MGLEVDRSHNFSFSLTLSEFSGLNDVCSGQNCAMMLVLLQFTVISYCSFLLSPQREIPFEEKELNLDKLFIVLMWEMQQILPKIWNIAPCLRGRHEIMSTLMLRRACSEAQLSRSSAAIHLHVTA